MSGSAVHSDGIYLSEVMQQAKAQEANKRNFHDPTDYLLSTALKAFRKLEFTKKSVQKRNENTTLQLERETYDFLEIETLVNGWDMGTIRPTRRFFEQD